MDCRVKPGNDLGRVNVNERWYNLMPAALFALAKFAMRTPPAANSGGATLGIKMRRLSVA
jgi:hypothetical protein